MKVLFFISSMRGGGAERVMSILCNHLTNRGHEVFLATNTSIPFAYTLDENVKIIDLYKENHSTKNKLLYFLRLYQNIRSIIKTIRPDISVSFIWSLNVHVLIAKTGLSAPVITSEHSTFTRISSRYEYFVRICLNKLAKKVIVLTEKDANFIGNRLNRMVIPNPLSYTPTTSKKERRENILAVGSIDRWEGKGFDNLIRIWSNIHKQYPGWVLEIAGTGKSENFNYLKSLAQDLGVSSSVVFLGFQKEINLLMQNSSVFVLASKYEGFPMVLNEAMSQGCACASFDCNTGPAEIITHNKNGLLVENQNMDKMQQTLSRLLNDKTLREKLSKNAIKDVERFSPGLIVDKWEKVMTEVRRETLKLN
ncbi:glycosyltransferase family 4 protein [uncultured Sunxiuqinia sp.]|uniref:glycosyltransferase family 4 protein n=1 Tax=uncultured Sunxiuqinia sp. TaxID=1573825 RepID=UPI0026399153|nr:glycosyltransferase family 4 protein [uncultured Sunxiuqinia sp.]